MALTKIGLGVSVNDGTGDDLRAAGAKINTSFTQVDANVVDIATNVTDIATNVTDIATNVTNIATNVTNIATNTADIANRVMLQSKSFITPSTGTISNSSSTIYVDTDLIVAITPKSTTSKLRINTQSGWSWISPNQQGVRIKLSYKIGAGAWTTYKSKIIRDYESIASGRDYFDNFFGQIDSPGITDEVQFKISFIVSSDTYNVDYKANGSLIIVDEIEE